MKKFEVGNVYKGQDLRKYAVVKRTETTVTIELAGFGQKRVRVNTSPNGDESLHSTLISRYSIYISA